MSDMFQLLRIANEITDQAILTPLTGGVSSDIVLVEDQGKKWVAKRALEKLKVAADWRADTNRYIAEYTYMKLVLPWLPTAVPKIRSVGQGYFTMEFLGTGFLNWKQELLAKNVEEKWGRKAGEIMGTIHARTWEDPTIKKQFETTENFESLRLDPYLRFTGEKYPSLKQQFIQEAERIKTTRCSLVHGDFSPKNILIKEDRMVILDCEVAWYGDPAFDAAFLTNHLVLKAMLQPDFKNKYAKLIQSFWENYQQALGVEKSLAVQKRAIRLQWMLMLARVDGKSPAEYVTDDAKQKIRNVVQKYLVPNFYPSFEQTFELLIP